MPGLISLFCGPGGFDQGFREEGFITRLAYDNDQACVGRCQLEVGGHGAEVAQAAKVKDDLIRRSFTRPSACQSPLSRPGIVARVGRGTPAPPVDAAGDKSGPELAQRQIRTVGRAQLI